MKKQLLVLTLLMAMPLALQAEEGKRGHKGPKLDINGDGYITKAEMLEGHKKRIDELFAKADKDNDGKLSKDEMKDVKKHMREKMKKHRGEMKERQDKMKERRGKKDMIGDVDAK